MLHFLLLRPVAVLMSFFVLILAGIIAFVSLPVSLLPDIDVPQIVVKINYPNTSPLQLEQNVLRPLRESLLTVAHLRDVQSEASSETGKVTLWFEYGTQMDLAYIEVNEKIDRLTPSLPRDLLRPQVLRINTSDVPIARLQINSKAGEEGHLELSALVDKVLKKRLEAIEGVSLVDLNGLQQPTVVITPIESRLKALGLKAENIQQTILQANQELGSVSVRDGQYRYYLKLGERLQSASEIARLTLRNPEGQAVPLTEIAHIKDTIAQVQGYHLLGRQAGIVINLHKQAQARMTELMPRLRESIKQFEADYPKVRFEITQDQSYLLDVAISNLTLDLVLGGVLAFLIVLVFLGSWQMPMLIGVILPSSLVLSFIVFYLFGISLNIISLSGLTLGLGMTIDNAIILFDHIGYKRKEGLPILEACVVGTMDMIAPLVSSALTTLVVFVPLAFLSGMAGALSYEQAVAVGAILGASVLVSFLLLPLLYLLLFRNSTKSIKEDNRLYKYILGGYKFVYAFFFRYKAVSFVGLLLAGVLGMNIAWWLPVEILPRLEQEDIILEIDWREPIEVETNQQRIKEVLKQASSQYKLTESDIGITQFWLQNEETTLQRAKIYFLCASQEAKRALQKTLRQYFEQHFPSAEIQLYNAPNAFELLFKQNKPYWEARFKNSLPNAPVPDSIFRPITRQFQQKLLAYRIEQGQGTHTHTEARLVLEREKMLQYGIQENAFMKHLQNLLGNEKITDLKQFGEIVPIRLQETNKDFQHKLQNAYFTVDSLKIYPTMDFVRVEYYQDYQKITADKGGIYHALQTYQQKPITEAQYLAKNIATTQNLRVDFAGEYKENEAQMWAMGFVICISIALLYFILAIEFESLVLPMVVMLTLPLGFAGSFLFLWLAGASLNLMAGLGLVVMLGIIDNETILKIDTYKRLRSEGLSLEEAIEKGGKICFKPVLMTSLTNILALLPVLFSSGMGADLQIPFVLAIIGGLSIGTFTALFFVPLAYYYVSIVTKS